MADPTPYTVPANLAIQLSPEEAIQVLQYLKDNGYYRGAVTGEFGGPASPARQALSQMLSEHVNYIRNNTESKTYSFGNGLDYADFNRLLPYTDAAKAWSAQRVRGAETGDIPMNAATTEALEAAIAVLQARHPEYRFESGPRLEVDGDIESRTREAVQKITGSTVINQQVYNDIVNRAGRIIRDGNALDAGGYEPVKGTFNNRDVSPEQIDRIAQATPQMGPVQPRGAAPAPRQETPARQPRSRTGRTGADSSRDSSDAGGLVRRGSEARRHMDQIRQDRPPASPAPAGSMQMDATTTQAFEAAIAVLQARHPEYRFEAGPRLEVDGDIESRTREAVQKITGSTVITRDVYNSIVNRAGEIIRDGNALDAGGYEPVKGTFNNRDVSPEQLGLIARATRHMGPVPTRGAAPAPRQEAPARPTTPGVTLSGAAATRAAIEAHATSGMMAGSDRARTFEAALAVILERHPELRLPEGQTITTEGNFSSTTVQAVQNITGSPEITAATYDDVVARAGRIINDGQRRSPDGFEPIQGFFERKGVSRGERERITAEAQRIGAVPQEPARPAAEQRPASERRPAAEPTRPAASNAERTALSARPRNSYATITQEQWNEVARRSDGNERMEGVRELIGHALYGVEDELQDSYGYFNHRVNASNIYKDDIRAAVREVLPHHAQALRNGQGLTRQMANEVLVATQAVRQNQASIESIHRGGDQLARTKAMAPYALRAGIIDQALHDTIMQAQALDENTKKAVAERFAQAGSQSGLRRPRSSMAVTGYNNAQMVYNYEDVLSERNATRIVALAALVETGAVTPAVLAGQVQAPQVEPVQPVVAGQKEDATTIVVEEPDAPATTAEQADPVVNIPAAEVKPLQETLARYNYPLGATGADGIAGGPNSNTNKSLNQILADITAHQRANGQPDFTVGNEVTAARLQALLDEMPPAWRSERTAGGDERVVAAVQAAERHAEQRRGNGGRVAPSGSRQEAEPRPAPAAGAPAPAVGAPAPAAGAPAPAAGAPAPAAGAPAPAAGAPAPAAGAPAPAAGGGDNRVPTRRPGAVDVGTEARDATEVASGQDIARDTGTGVDTPVAPGTGIPPVGGAATLGTVAGTTAAVAAAEAARQGNADGRTQGGAGQGSPGVAGRQQGSLALTSPEVEDVQGILNLRLAELSRTNPELYAQVMQRGQEAAEAYGTRFPAGRIPLPEGVDALNVDGKYGPMTHTMLNAPELQPHHLGQLIAEGAQPGFGSVRREPQVSFKNEEARAQLNAPYAAGGLPIREVPDLQPVQSSQIVAPQVRTVEALPRPIGQNLAALRILAEENDKLFTDGPNKEQALTALSAARGGVRLALENARANNIQPSREMEAVRNRLERSDTNYNPREARQLLADMQTVLSHQPALLSEDQKQQVNVHLDAFIRGQASPGQAAAQGQAVSGEQRQNNFATQSAEKWPVVAERIEATNRQRGGADYSKPIRVAGARDNTIYVAVSNAEATRGQVVTQNGEPVYYRMNGEHPEYFVTTKGTDGELGSKEVNLSKEEAERLGIAPERNRGGFLRRAVGEVAGAVSDPTGYLTGKTNDAINHVFDSNPALEAEMSRVGATAQEAQGVARDAQGVAQDATRAAGSAEQTTTEAGRAAEDILGNTLLPNGTPTRQQFLQQQRDPFGVNAGTPDFTNPQLSGIMQGLQGVQLAGTEVRAMTSDEAEAAIASFNRLAQQGADGQLAVTGERRVNTNQLT